MLFSLEGGASGKSSVSRPVGSDTGTCSEAAMEGSGKGDDQLRTSQMCVGLQHLS